MQTAQQKAIDQINQRYANTTTTSAPPKPGLLQKTGNALNKFGQAGSNLANGIFNTMTAPFQKAIGSGVRAVQAIPAVMQGDAQKANEIQNKPFTSPTGFKSDTFQGASIPQNLGSAAQTAAFLAPGTGLAKYGATGFLGGAGTELQNRNTTGLRVAGAGALGAVTDIGIQKGAQALQNMEPHPIFQRSTPIMDPATVEGATAARQQAASEGVNALNQATDQVGQFKNDLGTNFQQGAQKIEIGNPNLKLNLSNKQLETLNSLKESKLFSLPETVDAETNPLMGSNMSPAMLARNAGKMSELQNATKASLTPTEAQDLVTRLNKLTFAAKASGELAVNQQTIGLTNEIKQAASETFGPEWDQVYSNYAQGVKAVESLNDIINLDPQATPTDVNNSLNKVLKLGSTPEGKIILQQAVEEFKNQSGIDLTDPVQAMHQILDKQLALEETTKNVAKGGFGKQFMSGITNPSSLGRMVGRAAIGVGILYPAFRAIQKALKGK